MEAAGTTIQEFVGSVQRVTLMMSEIASASQEQMKGIDQVSDAVTAMDHVVQQNAGLVAEAAAATQNMADQAEHLMESVSRFKLHDEAVAELAPQPPRAMDPARVAVETSPRDAPRIPENIGRLVA